jgi:hypothetical protein
LADSALILGSRTTTTKASHRPHAGDSCQDTTTSIAHANLPARLLRPPSVEDRGLRSQLTAWGSRMDSSARHVSQRSSVADTTELRSIGNPIVASTSSSSYMRTHSARTRVARTSTLLRRLQSHEALEVENTRSAHCPFWLDEPE